MITSTLFGFRTRTPFLRANAPVHIPTSDAPQTSHKAGLKPHSRSLSPDSVTTISILESLTPAAARHSTTDNSSETTSGDEIIVPRDDKSPTERHTPCLSCA